MDIDAKVKVAKVVIAQLRVSCKALDICDNQRARNAQEKIDQAITQLQFYGLI